MRILVDRTYSNDDATLSNVYIDGRWFCFGLEDEHRDDKIPGETRIPAGTYDVNFRNVISPMTQRYRRKFDWFDYHLHIQDVPNFDYIYIHIGNTDEHTAGCLLLGKGANTSGECCITQSTLAYKSFYKKVSPSARVGDLTIEYRDSDMEMVA